MSYWFITQRRETLNLSFENNESKIVMKLKILKLEQMFVYTVNHLLSRFLHMYSDQVLQVRPLQKSAVCPAFGYTI